MSSSINNWRLALSKQATDAKHATKDDLSFFGRFVIRAPILPLATGLLTSVADLERGRLDADSYESKRALELVKLKELLSTPEVAESIHIASRSLTNRLYDGNTLIESHFERKLQLAAYKYIVRMSSRPTPFGRFASVGTGKIAKDNNLSISPRSLCYRVARVDMGYIFAVAETLIKKQAVLKSSTLQTNTTIYRVANSWRYIETYGEGIYKLSSIEGQPFLDHCIARCRQPSSFQALTEELMLLDNELSRDEIEEFVSQLVKDQVLVPDLLPALTTRAPAQDFANRLSGIPVKQAKTEQRRILFAQNKLDSLKNASSLEARSTYAEIEKCLGSSFNSRIYGDRLYQVDLHDANHCTSISHELCVSIGKIIEPLMKLCATPVNPELETFAARFTERFGANEVPLLIALDKDYGIEFGGSRPVEPDFASQVDFAWKEEPSSKPLSPRDSLLLNKISAAWQAGCKEIILRRSDIDALPNSKENPSPTRCSAVFELAKRQKEDPLGEGVDVYLKSVLSPLGAQYFGRFCSGQPAIDGLVSDMILEEEKEDPARLFAEIVHAPAGRTANIASRPSYRRYEIAILSASGVKKENQIPLYDILVGVSRGRIYLRSRERRAEIVPRLTNAHNYLSDANLSVYRFLALLSTQYAPPYCFFWGHGFDSCVNLPRVKIEEIVISPAIWRLTRTEVDRFRASVKQSSYERYNLVRRYCDENRLPRFTWLEDGSNSMLLDLYSPISIETFLSALPPNGSCQLIEAFQHPNNLTCRDGDGWYCNEFILPLSFSHSTPQDATEAHAKSENSPLGEHSTKRTDIASLPLPKSTAIFPGSAEWAYLKLYGSEEKLDDFVQEVLLDLVTDAFHPDPPRFFFIRYADPHWHLRVRLNSSQERLWTTIVPRLLSKVNKVAESYAIKDVTLDTYEPEIDRYGGEAGLKLCERIFCNDSIAVTQGLREIGTSNPSTRWKLAILSAYWMGNELMGDTRSAAALFDNLFTTFMERFYVTATLKSRLSSTFRRLRPDLESLLLREQRNEKSVAALDQVLLARQRGNLREISDLRAVCERGHHFPSVASSLIHMSMNRIFRSNANQDETLVYYLITRTLDASIARGGEHIAT